MNRIPSTREAWLTEISLALLDAAEAIPFGPLVGGAFGPRDLFHLGPATAFKFRGLRATKRLMRSVTDTALCSYVATISRDRASLSHPAVAFAFTYLASHFSLDLVSERRVIGLMDYIESHPEVIALPGSRALPEPPRTPPVSLSKPHGRRLSKNGNSPGPLTHPRRKKGAA
jgi:hypothetical protein